MNLGDIIFIKNKKIVSKIELVRSFNQTSSYC